MTREHNSTIEETDINLTAGKPSWYRLLRLVSIYIGSLMLLLLLITVSLCYGSADLTVAQLYQSDVLWQLRLPRTLLAALVGAHFAVAGLILQLVIRNPLADASVIGVSGGASFAIVMFLLLANLISQQLYGTSTEISLTWLPWVGMFGGIASASLVLGLGWRSHFNPAKLALYGVAIGAVLNGGVMWSILAWGGARTETSLLWLAGSLYGRDFEHIAILLPWSLISSLLLLPLLKPLSVMRFDDGIAKSLGLRLMFWRFFAIAVAVALAASATAVAGPVGFVGLIVPHFARLLVGGQIRSWVLISIIGGACLVVAADILSRNLISPLELPAGALTTLIGIPLLLFLLVQYKGVSR